MERRVTPDELPRVTEKLRIVCRACGQRGTYDVGQIWTWVSANAVEHQPTPEDCGYAFSNYFHCRECGSPGPWDVADYWKLMGLTLLARATGGDERGRLVFGTPQLFDGTIVQTPAMAEAYLLRLVAEDPQNAFLHTRLGNLLRGCHRRSDAAAWYSKALALDAGDIEARHNLFLFAVDESDFPAVVQHGLSLIHHLLRGRTTKSAELTRGIAKFVVWTLRDAPAETHALLLDSSGPDAAAPERRFVRALLAQEGDEDRIVDDAAERLLSGVPTTKPVLVEPAHTAVLATLDDLGARSGPPLDLISSLGELVQQEGLDAQTLAVMIQSDANGRIRVPDRHAIMLFDGKKGAVWNVPSLRELFRGDKAALRDMDQYPPSFTRAFFCLEKHVFMLCEAEGDRTDQEMEPVYSALRRRPDGKNHLGATHDLLWQATALMLGLHRLSGAEFEAIVGALERSVRRWALRPVSRNYVSYLRDQME